MSLVDHYRHQFAWRDWPAIFAALPPLHGALVLDLGCGVGDLAAELVARGARVIGVDLNEELLAAARARNLEQADFRVGDLRKLPPLGVELDGIWASFAAAYFTDLADVLAGWARALRPGGWIALTEVDDLFGHEPLPAAARARLDDYARDALAAGRYDFHMGGKLRDHLERAGFAVDRSFTVEDRELAFDGPALPEVLESWRERFARMAALRDLTDDFLACLADPAHTARARVHCCVAALR